ncbi:MAG: UbiX family flavin prenyltransferase [Bacteroidetes bacterium]|nr:MAG: UbiX family flavin prenyltransferase [Bacteroidota bacterium]
METKERNIVVAVTGASGAIYAYLLLRELEKYKNQINKVAVVFSKNAKTVWVQELENTEYKDIPYPVYENSDFFAPFASGSSSFNTMIICPCSMGTLARISNGISDSLITRAADVMLKERRKIIAVIRETPFNLIHIENMKNFTLAGGIVCPAIPSFYSKPQTIEEAALTVVNRVLSLTGINTDSYRWGEEK